MAESFSDAERMMVLLTSRRMRGWGWGWSVSGSEGSVSLLILIVMITLPIGERLMSGISPVLVKALETEVDEGIMARCGGVCIFHRCVVKTEVGLVAG